MQNYSLASNVVVFGGVPATGFGKDDAITITPIGATFVLEEGVDGGAVRSFTGSATADIQLTLLQTSPYNDFLSALYTADVESSNMGLGGAGVVPFMLNDLTGSTIIKAGSAFIEKPPVVRRTKETTDLVWMIKAADVKWTVGGAAL